MDQAQKQPVTIERQGRPIAAVISYDDYQDLRGNKPSPQEKEQALAFLNVWA